MSNKTGLYFKQLWPIITRTQLVKALTTYTNRIFCHYKAKIYFIIYQIRDVCTSDIITLDDISVHYNDVIMRTMASQITSLTIVYPTVYSGAYQRKHQSSASLAFVRGIHRWPVNFPHKGPVTRKMFPFDDVITNVAEVSGRCVVKGTANLDI